MSEPSIRVLLVDDHRENLVALEALLEPLGLECVAADSGVAALRHLLSQDFALILLDVRMPGMDGFETAERIKQRERSKRIPIIFLTADTSDEEVVRRGYAMGAVDYLHKPIKAEVLRSKVSVFVELHRQRQEIAAQAERLAAANQALMKADRYKDEFLSVISHELRTPLNFITGFASLLDDEAAGPLSEAQHHYLGKILSGADRMLMLVDDLLDMSKIQAGRFDLSYSRLDFVRVLKEALAVLIPLAEEKELTLAIDAPDELAMDCDGRRVTQILTNLVSNAIKFTPKGGRIEVHAALEDDRVVTRVTDTGAGFSPADAKLLFERFQQLDMGPTREAGGVGLGLSIVKALVEAHGGSVWAESPGPRQGSTFGFSLPLAPKEPHVPKPLRRRRVKAGSPPERPARSD